MSTFTVLPPTGPCSALGCEAPAERVCYAGAVSHQPHEAPPPGSQAYCALHAKIWRQQIMFATSQVTNNLVTLLNE